MQTIDTYTLVNIMKRKWNSLVEPGLSKPSVVLQLGRRLSVVQKKATATVPVPTKQAPPVKVSFQEPEPFTPPERKVSKDMTFNVKPPTSKEANQPAVVYFITDGTAVKVGYTTDLNKRLSTLQVGNPRRLEVLRVVPFATATEAYEYEQSYHNTNRRYQVRGEWFNIK